MKQYFRYFRVGFIILGVLAVITAAVGIGQLMNKEETTERSNYECPEERVYDKADVLTAEEEEQLRRLIADTEQMTGCDIVLVTIQEPVLDLYGYTQNTDYYWEKAMMNYADDFYDLNNYGYNEVHGDGVLLLDNWYEGQGGTWLSTCGKAYEKYTDRMINQVLDEVAYQVESNPYRAYRDAIALIGEQMSGGQEDSPVTISFLTCLFVALIPAAIFIFTHLKSSEGAKTTVQSTYLDAAQGGAPAFSVRRDDLVNKYVTSQRIQTSSSSGGSHSSGGRAGSHRSSSGVRHGGGGRRR